MRWLLALFVIAATPQTGLADDVYNFYFQKSEGGENNVKFEKAGDGEIRAVTSDSKKNTVPPHLNTSDVQKDLVGQSVSSPPSVPEQKSSFISRFKKSLDSFDHWTLNVASAETFEGIDNSFYETLHPYYEGSGEPFRGNYSEFMSTSGLLIGAAYNFNKFLSANLDLIISDDPIDGSTEINAGAGLKLTPLRWNLFGYDLLSFYFVTGYSSMKWLGANYDRETRWDVYTGGGMGIHLATNFKIFFESRAIRNSTENGRALAGVSYDF